MDSTPRPRGPTGADLLAGTPEAVGYCRSLIPAAFPDGVPSPEVAARAAGAIWRHLREHPDAVPVAWDPDDADAQRISAAFQRDGLAAAFAQAAGGRRGARPAGVRVTAYSEVLLP
jgi:tRNA U34 5-methylaminomethyl-2-thiouridine-forming methyltransferase MnmC